jgi:hypothetical protein
MIVTGKDDDDYDCNDTTGDKVDDYGKGATGDNDDDDNGNGATGNVATGYNDDNDGDGRRRKTMGTARWALTSTMMAKA